MKWLLYLAIFITFPTFAAPKGKTDVNELKEVAREQARLEKEKAQSWADRIDKKHRMRYALIKENGPIEQYVMACLEKIMDYGNANYPEAAKGKLYGTTFVTFEILSDGNIRAPEVAISSGHPVLDKFIIRAIRSASPCTPFTDEIRELADIVGVIRPYSFVRKENGTESKNQVSTEINSGQ